MKRPCHLRTSATSNGGSGEANPSEIDQSCKPARDAATGILQTWRFKVRSFSAAAAFVAATTIFSANPRAEQLSFTDIPQRPAKFSPDDSRSSSYRPILDDTPLFVTTPPKGEIGNKVVLRVKVIRFISGGACTQDTWPTDPATSSQTDPTAFALAEVLSVEKGQFNADSVMLCGNRSREHFSIGQIGLAYGTPSKNLLGQWRVVISESYRERAIRRRSEGAYCLIVFCFDLPASFN